MITRWSIHSISHVTQRPPRPCEARKNNLSACCLKYSAVRFVQSAYGTVSPAVVLGMACVQQQLYNSRVRSDNSRMRSVAARVPSVVAWFETRVFPAWLYRRGHSYRRAIHRTWVTSNNVENTAILGWMRPCDTARCVCVRRCRHTCYC